MENIIRLADAYGVIEQEIEDFVSSIVDFAEIGGAIDRNVGLFNRDERQVRFWFHDCA